MADFEKAKALLQKKQGATSLYDHLAEVLLKLVTEDPADSLALFEHLSGVVKKASFPGETTGARAGGKADEGESKAAALEWSGKAAALFRAPEPADGVTPEATQDLIADGPLLEWAGVSFGSEELYRTHLALKQLSNKYPARGLRLWGKVQGLQNDYLIAEGQIDDDGEEDATDAWGNTLEKTGTGANKYTYWVARFAGDDWVQLPNVTPQQIIVARQLRRYLTGNLDAVVGGHPPFPGKEAAYLRARIALVAAETTVSPAGVFVASEEEGSNDVNPNEEEFDAPDLTSLDGWAHHTLLLNKLGRVKPNPPKTNADGEEIEDPDAPEASAALRPLSEDPEGSWAVRPYPRAGAADDDTPKLVVLRSTAWPGAFVVGSGKRYINVYVGFGLPNATGRFAPSIPGPVGDVYNTASEEAPFVEGADVTTDPNEGKTADGDGGDGGADGGDDD